MILKYVLICSLTISLIDSYEKYSATFLVFFTLFLVYILNNIYKYVTRK